MGRHQLQNPQGPAARSVKTKFHPPVGRHKPQDYCSLPCQYPLGLTISKLTSALRHLESLSQQSQDLTPPTSGVTPAPRHLVSLTSRPPPALGHPGTHSQPCQEPALQSPTPESSSAYKLARTTQGNPRTLQPAISCPALPHQLAVSTQGRASHQPNRKPATPTRPPTVVSSSQKKDPCSPCRGHPYSI